MGLGSSLLAGDPFRVACARGDLSIERHGGLQRDEGKPGPDVLGEVSDERSALLFHQSDLDLDARAAQAIDGARDVWRWVAAPDHDARNAGVEDCLGARTGAALVVAGLQGHEERRALDRGAGVSIASTSACASPALS